jgi:hypothetical protein
MQLKTYTESGATVFCQKTKATHMEGVWEWGGGSGVELSELEKKVW